jgi:hypothetical protein
MAMGMLHAGKEFLRKERPYKPRKNTKRNSFFREFPFISTTFTQFVKRFLTAIEKLLWGWVDVAAAPPGSIGFAYRGGSGRGFENLGTEKIIRDCPIFVSPERNCCPLMFAPRAIAKPENSVFAVGKKV